MKIRSPCTWANGPIQQVLQLQFLVVRKTIKPHCFMLIAEPACPNLVAAQLSQNKKDLESSDGNPCLSVQTYVQIQNTNFTNNKCLNPNICHSGKGFL